MPGVTVHGADAGRWLEQQRPVWEALSDEQRERLTVLGVTPAASSGGSVGTPAVELRAGMHVSIVFGGSSKPHPAPALYTSASSSVVSLVKETAGSFLAQGGRDDVNGGITARSRRGRRKSSRHKR
ncbi:hypothetical protein ACIGW8_37470 [Streptomyces sioyaensis]|uniref:hypothetical protein n=1 Tax=Streptomyces sioyaensis TaxID=67364 RepID=UPI0037D92FA9